MSEDARVADLVDEFLDLKRLGRAPDPESFARRHPDVASQVLEALAGLAAVEDAARRVRDEPLAGKTIGDYTIEREIGRGGMGVVYEAEDTALHRRVALKVLPAAALLDPRHLQRFRHEAQAAAQLHHGNIVPVYGVGSSGGLHYYAMQFIDGTDLGTVLRELREGARGREPLSSQSVRTPQYFAAVCRLGIQAAEALDHAHQVGVVHRDVKPANLIVDAAGHLWVTDFGLAQFERGSAVTRTGDLVGTFRYMSPEQARGKRLPIDHRTDVYSLGATLYELATLEPAVDGEQPQEVLEAVWNREPVPPRSRNPAVPSELETILLKALAKDPVERYETAAALAEDLRRFLDDRPIGARPPSLAHRARKWARRHRAIVGAGVSLLSLSVAGLVLSTVLIAREKARAEAALQGSEQNFQRALRAVDAMLFEVANEDLEGVPFMTAVRERLLSRALDFYREFLAAQGPRPELTLGTARIHRRAGEILGLLGRGDEQQQALERALALLDGLDRGDPDVRRERSDALRQVAAQQASRRTLAEALGTARQSRDEQLLVATATGTAEDLNRLGEVHLALGRIANLNGEHGEAAQAIADAVSTLERAWALDPGPSQTERLARALRELGRDSMRTDRAAAEAEFRRARDLLDGIREERGARSALCDVLGDLGGVLLARGAAAEAEACCAERVTLLTALEAEHPGVATYAAKRARAESALGVTIIAQGARVQEARGHFERAVALAEEVARRWPTQAHRWIEAVCLTNLGASCRAGSTVEAELSLSCNRRAGEILAGLVRETEGSRNSKESTPPLTRMASGHYWFAPEELPDFSFHHANSLLYEARNLRELGRRREALELLLRRGHEDCDLALHLIESGGADLQRGIEIARRGAEANPDAAEGEWWAALALGLYRRGDLDGASEALEQTLRVDRQPYAWFVLALTEASRGNLAAARTAYETGCARVDARTTLGSPPGIGTRELKAEAARALGR